MLGAGHVGRTLVDALHEQHDVVVIDVNAERLAAVADRYDVRTVHGDGTTRKVVQKAGAEQADLLIACSSREEANLVCAILVKRLSGAKTVVRTTSVELLDAWRQGELDIDFMISPELETGERDRWASSGCRRPARPTSSPTARCSSSSSTSPPRRRTAR